MNICIENQTKQSFDFRGYKKLIAEVIETCAETKGIPSNYEVNVLLVSPETIRQINRQTRDMDKVTDVLSFPYFEFDSPGDTACLPAHDEEMILGDIVLCAEQVVLQAKEYGHSQKRECAFLIVHSMLHLLGFDHMTPEDEAVMTKEADALMTILGISR